MFFKFFQRLFSAVLALTIDAVSTREQNQGVLSGSNGAKENFRQCDPCDKTAVTVGGLKETCFVCNDFMQVFSGREISLLTSGHWIIVSNDKHFHISHTGIFLRRGNKKKSPCDSKESMKGLNWLFSGKKSYERAIK